MTNTTPDPKNAGPELPSNIQDAEKQLQNAVYMLGRADYDLFIADDKVKFLRNQIGRLAQHTNELRAKATEELNATASTGAAKPSLTVVPDQAAAPDAPKAG